MKKKFNFEELITKAKESRNNAYAPYSHFSVGAAILGESGKIYTGCNVENSSFGLSVCAERVAMFKAISEGEKKIQILALVADTKMPVQPCGACLQVLAEFNDDMLIVSSDLKRVKEKKRLSEIFPKPFHKES